MEHGFYHLAHGYWQTTDAPPADIRAAYPEGTVEVPLRPGADHLWTGESWEPAPARRSVDQDLQKAQADLGVTIPDLVYDVNPDKLEAGYGKLIPVLVQAIKDLSAKVNHLEAHLEAQK